MKYLRLFETIDDNYIKNTVENYKKLLKSLVPLATEKVKEDPDKKKKIENGNFTLSITNINFESDGSIIVYLQDNRSFDVPDDYYAEFKKDEIAKILSTKQFDL